MFSSRMVDKSNTCNIIKHSLLDDLYPYVVTSKGALDFETDEGGTSSGNLVSKINILSNLMNDSDSTKEVWKPIFIKNDDNVETKALSNYGSYSNGNPSLKSGRLGIENFYTFTPQFKSWTVSGSATMSIDWLLNKPNTYYAIYYGILGWYRKSNLSSNRTYGGSYDIIDNFPNGSRLKQSGGDSSKVFIKISNSLLYDLSKSSRSLDSQGTWTFKDESTNGLVDIASLPKDTKFSLSDQYYSINHSNLQNPTLDSINTLGLSDGAKLWISDGDFFSFFNSEQDKAKSQPLNTPSNSYISASLYNTYANIYRILTLDNIRSFDARDLKKSRAYKKLAQLISTSPLSSDFGLYALDYIEIRKIVQEYINDPKASSIDSEITHLQTILINISKILQSEIVINSQNPTDNKSLFLDTKSSFNTINNNLITNHTQLFKKLINKYGANLSINPSSNTTISIKSDIIPDNDGLCISQIMEYFCDKNLTGNSTSPAIVSNDETITFDNIELKTDSTTSTSNTSNTLNLNIDSEKKLSIPLYNGCKPEYGTLNKSLINIKLTYASDVPANLRSDGVALKENGSILTYIFKAGFDVTPDAPPQSIPLSCLTLNTESFANGNGLVSEDLFLSSQINTTWEQLEGPEGYFDSGISSGSTIGNNITFYTRYTGRFTVQCTSSTPFGLFRKQKTFYVVDGRQLILQVNKDGSYVYVANTTSYLKYWDGTAFVSPPDPNPYLTDKDPILLNQDNLKVITPNINRIAFNNLAGVFWSIKSNLLVREDVGSRFKSRIDNILELSGGGYKFKYDTNNIISKTNPTLSLNFKTNNTNIKIFAIFLERVRTNNDDCTHCLSFYEPKIVAQEQAVQLANIGAPDQEGSTIVNVNRSYRHGKNPAFFPLSRFKLNASTNIWDFDRYIYFTYPNISTKFSPKIKTYGGYSDKLVSTFGVNIPDHPAAGTTTAIAISGASGIMADNPTVLSNVSGYKLDYVDKNKQITMCYQKILPLTPTTGYIIPFEKGVLHPNSGWLPYDSNGYKIHANKSSVLKFNPGARDSFSFIGPSFSNLHNGAIDVSGNNMLIRPKIFSSSIELGIADHIQWEPNCASRSAITRYNDNQKHKEYTDIDHNISNHGYRILFGGDPKRSEPNAKKNLSPSNDEFQFEQNIFSNTASYFFAVTGPSLPLDKINTSGNINIRDPRVNNFGIKDIEVKLNFLNYVNTKNLVVWLEAELDDTELRDRYPNRSGSKRSPLRSTKEFIDQFWDPQLMDGDWTNNMSAISGFDNTIVLDYIKKLSSINSNKKGEPLKLYLLNQETIQNNTYNFSIKFSDSASKCNTPYDINILPTATGTDFTTGILKDMLDSRQSVFYNGPTTSQLSINQHAIHSNDSLLPTICATGYSDRQCCLYNSILKYNKLNLNNNTFSKFTSPTLFRGKIPDSLGEGLEFISPDQNDPDLTGKTKFTLKIMVLDEIDDMYPSDNIYNQYKPGLDTVDNIEASSSITNSLCNWELILHVGPTHQPLPHTNHSISSYGSNDILSLLNYNQEPPYPGYSFIADLAPYKHLLPLANYNAPISCVQDLTTCIGQNDNDPSRAAGLTIRFSQYPNFFQTALINTFGGIAAAAAYGGGTTAGTLVGMGTASELINNLSQSFIDYLNELQFTEKLYDAGRDVFVPIYNKYPFGSPEKILINFKKPDSLWYSLEATIFKYHNTPILKPNKYQFVRVQRGNGKNISEFKFTQVTDILELIDTKFIKQLDYGCSEFDGLKNTTTYPINASGLFIDNGDLININLIPNDPKASEATVKDCKKKSGIYVALKDESWSKIDNNTANKLSKSMNYLTHNIILSGGKQFFDNTFSTLIKDNKVIFIKNTRIPYDIFKINDTLECYDEAESEAVSPTGLLSPKLVNKALIFKNNQYHTCLILDSSIKSQNTISTKPENHTFFLYNNRTTIDNKIYKPYNIWGLDQNKKLNSSLTPNIETNTHSLGSYGDVSPFVYKNILTNNTVSNNLLTHHDIFNNRFNDKLKYNKITVYDNNGKPINQFKNSSCYGFSYSDADINPSIIDTKNFAYYITPEDLVQSSGDPSELFEKLKSQIKFSTSNSNDTAYSYSYIRADLLNNDTINQLPNGIVSGELSIENDFVEYIPLKILDKEQFDQLVTRLTLIDNLKFNEVDQSIGKPDQTSTVLDSANLKSIIKHYQQLPDDPAKCHRSDNPNKAICYKWKTQQKINDLYIERKEILDLLDAQALRYIDLTYITDDGQTSIDGEILYENQSYITIRKSENADPVKISQKDILWEPTPPKRYYKQRSTLRETDSRYLDPKVLPKIEPIITTDPTTQAIIITYKPVNTDHYWINIDPKQCTFKDFASNPKILIETRYQCSLANQIYVADETPTIKNNVCPRQNLLEEPKGSDADIDETLNITPPFSYTYKIKQEKINQAKTKFQGEYPAIKDWKRITKTRYFNINGDQTFDIAPGLEITVRSEEDYWVPVTMEDADERSLGNGDYSADTYTINNPLPGMDKCIQGTTLGSPYGHGLLDSNGDRTRVSNRVCNILNLDNTNKIEVTFKRVPRILRGVDLLYTVYRYGAKSIYRQMSAAVPPIPHETDNALSEGSINNSLYYWICFQNNAGFLGKAATPDFFKLQNEMMFRSLFGSIDKIENRTDILGTYYPWELIPYEYDKE